MLLGDSAVGKSSFLLRYASDKFSSMSATVGVDWAPLRVELEGGVPPFNVEVWDTAGQEKFDAITSHYYRGANGVIFCYDVTSRESLESVRTRWIPNKIARCEPDVPALLVGCKADLPRAVLPQDAAVFVTECPDAAGIIGTADTSSIYPLADQRSHVRAAFEVLARALVARQAASWSEATATPEAADAAAAAAAGVSLKEAREAAALTFLDRHASAPPRSTCGC